MSIPIRVAVVWMALMPRSVVAQSASGIAPAFRENTRALHEKILLAAEAMPDDKYSFKPTPRQNSFAWIVLDLSWRNDHLCSRIAGVETPTRSTYAATSNKDTLVMRLWSSIQFCEQALRTLDDSKLNDSIVVDMNGSSPRFPRSRASAIVRATTYWADMYGQLAQYLRLNGRVPPIPCAAPSGEENCDNSINRCVETTRGVGGATFTLSDAPYSVTSDGLGPYRRGKSNVAVIYIGWPLVLNLLPHQFDTTVRRSIRVDLNHPVAGDIGVPLGVISADQGVEVAAQWYTETDFTSHSMLDIPVGTTVTAQQIDVGFQLHGHSHAIQVGPQPWGHCWSDGTAVYGTGTSKGTIQRTTLTQWIVDLPPGSVGRLFDIHLSSPNAVNKGLYYVSLHFVIER